jgi:nickel-type superoxide dismutase maturation protease
MQPTVRPGDHVLVWRWIRPRRGDIIVLRDPEAPASLLLKRVDRGDAAGYTVLGDSPNVSRDSREFGAVPASLVVGRVIYRYMPASRRGRLV